MRTSNSNSTYLVLCLSNLLGGATKGVTGFGSAILNLVTWIVFKVAGVDSGTLQQAVVTEALASTLMAPALLYVTRAHATADLTVVAAISLFVALSSPLGAAILANLDAKAIELAMAAILAAILLGEAAVKGWQRGSSGSSSTRHTHRHRQQEQQGGPVQQQQQQQQEEGAGHQGIASSKVCQGCVRQEQGSPGDAPGELVCSKLGEKTASNNDASNSSSSSSSSGRSSRGGLLPGVEDALAAAAAAAAGAEPDDSRDAVDTEVMQPLLGDAGDAATRDVEAAKPPSPAAASTARSCNGWRWCSSSSRAPAWLKVLGWGSVAGTLSGIMEGLTGMNGPPIMFMYRALDTPKAVVRGNNAFLNLLQMRLVPYYTMGLMPAADLPLYGATCVAGLAGMVLGNALSKRMDQGTFQAALGVLMVLCCVLMAASGLGLVE